MRDKVFSFLMLRIVIVVRGDRQTENGRTGGHFCLKRLYLGPCEAHYAWQAAKQPAALAWFIMPRLPASFNDGSDSTR